MKRKNDKRFPIVVLIGATLALICLLLLLLLIWGQRSVLAVPDNIYETTVNAIEELHRNGKCPNFKIITFSGSKPNDQIIAKADIIIIRMDSYTKKLYTDEKIKPIKATKVTEKSFPPAILSTLRATLPCGSPELIPAIPIAIDPYIMLWRIDWTGGVDGSPPQFYEEQQDKKGHPLVSPIFSLAGDETDTILAWLGYMTIQGLRDTASLENPDFTVQAIAKFEEMASRGWFQQGAFSYGWDDSLALVIDGKAKATIATLSRYYELAMPLRAKIKVGALPPLRGATKLASVGNILVACKTNRIRLPLNERSIVKALSNEELQSTIALHLGYLPANMSSSVRDLSSRTAGDAVRSGAAFLIPAFLDAPLPDGTKPSDALASALRKAAMTKR